MPTYSPLATLLATLTHVCHQAEQNHVLLRKNEAATRAALIDPVLRALGWDTADVTMVVPEFAIGSKQRPDYFLKNHNGAVHFVIEAKKLGEPLDKMGHTGKLIGYAFQPLTIDFAGPAKQLGKPQWLRLPDGQEHPLKSWKDILLKVAELALQTQPKLSIPLLDKAGKKTVLLGWAPPKAGLSFTPLSHQGQAVYLYTNYDVKGIIANALHLLQQLPKALATKVAISF